MSRETPYNSTNFNRPPRVRLPSLEGEQIEIPAPNALPTAQEQNALLSLLPVLSMAGMGLVYVLRSDDSSLELPTVGVAILALVIGVFAMRWRRRDKERQKQEIHLNYLRALDQIRIRLQAAQDAQIGILNANFPAPADYLHIALSRDMRLWQRRPSDTDFAAFRIGSGRVPSQVEIVPPPPDDTRAETQLAFNLANNYRFLDDAPVTVPLINEASSAIGFCGKCPDVMRAVRAAVCHLAVLHSPDDLHIYLAASGSQADEWRWITWLPHSSLAQPSGGELIAFDAVQIRNLMGGIAQLVDERKAAVSDKAAPPNPHLLLIVDESQFVKLEAVYPTLLREGAALSVSVICIASTFEALPGDCAAVIQVGEKGMFQYVSAQANGGPAVRIEGRAYDGLSAHESEQIARSLAAISANNVSNAERIPQRVDFLAMYGVRRVEDLTAKLRVRWSRSIPDGILPFPALLGAESLTTYTEIWLDETHHGPHGMLAGTTGAGKSELLQSLICSMVIEHDPRLLNLLLIDFKGGSTFNVFANLPHTVGMVTNLDGTLVARTLAALKAETDWRQTFLKSMRVRDITQYHRIYSQEISAYHFGSANYKPLPHLFIIVDEFAQLAKEMPDFLRELVRTAQVGRSLGLHLILGTQSPMDVITDEMNANLQFRICLRVQNLEASRAMLRRPDAAYLPASYPGRGYFQVGEQGTFKQFQTAYVGAEYHRENAPAIERAPSEVPILEVMSATSEKLDLLPRPPKTATHTYTVAQAVADLVAAYAQQERIPLSKPILLRPLGDQITLADTFEHVGVGGWNGRNWLAPGRDHLGRPIPLGSAPVGLVDDAANRTQYPLWLHLGSDDGTTSVRRKDGHILIVGAPGTGKTMLLRTLALSAALLHPPDKLHLYFVSFTGTGIDDLGNLPHAERVIYGAETERIRRLLARLIRILEERQAGKAARTPLIAIFLDQYEGFREMARSHDHLMAQFERLLMEGRAAGIAFVITASTVDSVPDRLRSIIGQRIAFSLGDISSYAMLVGRLNTPPDNAPPPGRGYVYNSPPLLCQIALPQLMAMDGRTNEAEMLNRMAASIQEMRAGYETISATHAAAAQSPQPVHVLPSRIDLKQLLDEVSAINTVENHIVTPLGRWDNDALTPFEFDWTAAGGQFIVTGPPGSGKTNLLYAAAISAAAAYSPDQLGLILIDADGRSSAPLSRLKHTVAYMSDPQDFDRSLRALQAELESGSTRKFVLMIDDYDSFCDMLRLSPELNTLTTLRDLLRSYGGERLFLWIAAYLDHTTDALTKYLLMRRTGFALVFKDSLTRLNIRNGGISAEMMPTGRAYIPSERGNSIGIVQTALVSDVASAVEGINAAWEGYGYVDLGANPIHLPTRPNHIPSEPENAAASLDPIADIDVAGLIEDLLGSVSGSHPLPGDRS